MARALFGDSVSDRGADLLDPCSGEGWGDVKGGIDMTLEASECIGPSETSRAAIEGLTLYL